MLAFGFLFINCFLISCEDKISNLDALINSTYLPTRKFESSFPYISGDTVRECCNHILDVTVKFDPKDVKLGDTVFVMVNFLEHFFDLYHPRITQKYILVTHHFFDESDDPVPGKFVSYLDDPKIMGWFSHNIDIKFHPKMHSMPIGISNAHYRPNNKKLFDEGIEKYKDKVHKNRLLFMGFTINTYAKEREKVFNIFKNKSFCTNINNLELTHSREWGINLLNSFDQFLLDLAKHKFILSPRGNGLDCFRTWEALLMGCYPIVISSTLDPLFSDLPVVIINDWQEITEEFLEKKYLEMVNKKYNWNKLYMPYWINKFNALKENFKNNEI